MEPKLSRVVNRMREPHLQSHVTIDHVVTCQVKMFYLHIHKTHVPQNLNQDEGVPSNKSRDTSIMWSREKSKPSYFLNHKVVEM